MHSPGDSHQTPDRYYVGFDEHMPEDKLFKAYLEGLRGSVDEKALAIASQFCGVVAMGELTERTGLSAAASEGNCDDAEKNAFNALRSQILRVQQFASTNDRQQQTYHVEDLENELSWGERQVYYRVLNTPQYGVVHHVIVNEKLRNITDSEVRTDILEFMYLPVGNHIVCTRTVKVANPDSMGHDKDPYSGPLLVEKDDIDRGGIRVLRISKPGENYETIRQMPSYYHFEDDEVCNRDDFDQVELASELAGILSGMSANNRRAVQFATKSTNA